MDDADFDELLPEDLGAEVDELGSRADWADVLGNAFAAIKHDREAVEPTAFQCEGSACGVIGTAEDVARRVQLGATARATPAERR